MSGNVLGGNLTVNLIAVTDEFKRKMNEAGNVVNSVVGKIEENKQALRNTGLALTALGGSITAAFGVFVGKASRAEETTSKFLSVFKEEAPKAKKFVDEYSLAVGRSRTDIMDWMGVLQDTFVPLGFARDRASEFSQTLVTLGVDLASFNNANEPDVIRDLQSAIVGNHETMRKYGVIINQTALDQELLNMGIAGGVEEATEAEKAQARLNIIMAGTTDAQGDALRTANGFANSMRAFKAVLEEVAITLGTHLLPPLGTVIQKLTDITGNVVDFMREHPKLTGALAAITAAFGALSLAVGTLLLGATALPALMTAFGSLSGLLAMSGPVGIALVTAAGLIYALYENWDVVCAGIKTGWETLIKPTLELLKVGFTTVWDTVKQVSEWIWGKIFEMFTSISNALTPMIDLFIGGFESTWDTVKTVFGFIWDKVSGVVQAIYDKFRWILDKLGIELPEMEDLWNNIGDAGESAADGVMSKWDEMKESFRGNMEANQSKHEETVAAIGAQEAALTDAVIAEQEKREASDEEQAALVRENRAIEHAAMVQEMLEEESRRKDETVRFDSTLHDEMVQDYGAMLTDEELAHAEFLRVTGGQWQTYIEEVTKPGPFETMFAGVKDNFISRIDEMGDQWIENIHTGSFHDSFTFMGEYLKRTFESAIMDIEKNILKSFLDRVGEYLGGLFSGEGGLFDRLKKGLGSLVSDIGGAFSSDGALVNGVKSVGGAVLGTLGTAGSALASGLGTAGSAAMGAIGALGVGTLGVGAAIAGIAYGIHKLTGGKETKGNHGRRLAKEYAGQDGGYIPPIAYTNWQILEYDGNESKSHGRSYAIKLVDQIMKRYLTGEADGTSQDMYNEIEQTLTTNRPKWSPEMVGKYAALAKDTIDRALLSDEAVLTFHTGGIIPGILGQERLINAYAGEEILRHDDPRHSSNIGLGGITVNITGNNISSALDMQQLGDMAAARIFDQLKLRTRITRY